MGGRTLYNFYKRFTRNVNLSSFYGSNSIKTLIQNLKKNDSKFSIMINKLTINEKIIWKNKLKSRKMINYLYKDM